jgi:hypothetical protein
MPGAVSKEYHINFSPQLGHAFVDLQGDVEEVDFRQQLGDIEDLFLDMLRELRSSGMYARLMIHLHLTMHRLAVKSIEAEPTAPGATLIISEQVIGNL